jgi:RNA polymerase sigma-70 factor (ECF subfamily)
LPALVRDADFERLVRRHGQDLYAFLLYRTGDHWLAEELLQDALERAYRARTRFDPRRSSEKTWLISIALNRWKDVLRKHANESVALEKLSRDTPPPEGMERVEERRALLTAMEGLAPEEREVLALVYGADLTAKQVAALLDVPVTTVQGRVYRGMRRLRDTLE